MLSPGWPFSQLHAELVVIYMRLKGGRGWAVSNEKPWFPVFHPQSPMHTCIEEPRPFIWTFRVTGVSVGSPSMSPPLPPRPLASWLCVFWMQREDAQTWDVVGSQWVWGESLGVILGYVAGERLLRSYQMHVCWKDHVFDWSTENFRNSSVGEGDAEPELGTKSLAISRILRSPDRFQVILDS